MADQQDHLNDLIKTLVTGDGIVKDETLTTVFAITNELLNASIHPSIDGLAIHKIDYEITRASLQASILLTETCGLISIRSKDTQIKTFLGFIHKILSESRLPISFELTISNTFAPRFKDMPFETALEKSTFASCYAANQFLHYIFSDVERLMPKQLGEFCGHSLWYQFITNGLMGILEDIYQDDKEQAVLKDAIHKEIKCSMDELKQTFIEKPMFYSADSVLHT